MNSRLFSTQIHQEELSMGVIQVSEAQFARDENGNIAPRAQMYVFNNNCSALVDVYAEASLTSNTIQENPLKADDEGRFGICYLHDGQYRVIIKSENGKVLKELDSVKVSSPLAMGIVREFTTVSDLLADVVLSYSAGRGCYKIMPGEFVTVADGRYSYVVAEEAAVDVHLTTIGGIKLRVRAGDNGTNTSLVRRFCSRT